MEAIFQPGFERAQFRNCGFDALRNWGMNY